MRAAVDPEAAEPPIGGRGEEQVSMSTSVLPGARPDRLEEECAVFGVFAPGEDVARMTCFGLQALQHRGQESAGIAVGDGETIMAAKDLGLVTQVFDEATLAALRGLCGRGPRALLHERRRGLVGGGPAAHLRHRRRCSSRLAHNGTLVNTNRLRAQLDRRGRAAARRHRLRGGRQGHRPASRGQTHHLREGIRYAMEDLEGAYAMVLASPDALYAFRDPNGIRPLCIGKLPEGRGWVVSSETCGLDIVGAEYVRDVEPGEIVRFTDEGITAEQAVRAAQAGQPASSSTCTSPAPTPCIDGQCGLPGAPQHGPHPGPTRRPCRAPTSCSACPTPACRRRWASLRRAASRSPTAS